jgi:hypothetical protein
MRGEVMVLMREFGNGNGILCKQTMGMKKGGEEEVDGRWMGSCNLFY